MPIKFTAVRIDKNLSDRLRDMSDRTGISMARIASDGINKELQRLESIFSRADEKKNK